LSFLSQCLSRACLGKRIVFRLKRHRKKWSCPYRCPVGARVPEHPERGSASTCRPRRHAGRAPRPWCSRRRLLPPPSPLSRYAPAPAAAGCRTRRRTRCCCWSHLWRFVAPAQKKPSCLSVSSLCSGSSCLSRSCLDKLINACFSASKCIFPAPAALSRSFAGFPSRTFLCSAGLRSGWPGQGAATIHKR
jgi:hypothetical protein